MRTHHRLLPLVLFVLSISLGQGLVASSVLAQQEVESVRSTPKDTTLYARPAVIEDYAPPGAESEAISPLPTVTVVDVVVNNTDLNLTNTDTFNDGETSIAVNPANTNEIVITAFSGGWGTNAVLWHSMDGGVTWTKRSTIPAPPGITATGCPCDQAVDYGRESRLSGAFLDISPPPVGSNGVDVYSGTTTDPANAAAWNWLAPASVTQRTNNLLAHSFGNVDQPWLLVNRDVTNAAQDNIYVAYDDFSNTDGIDGPDMRIAVSLGANPPNFTRDAQSGNSVGAINPGHRLAVDPRNGFVYSLFQRCVVNCATLAANPKTINYMLNRSTNGGRSWSLNGSATGIVAATGDSTQPQPKFGTVNALLGGVHHAAVNPSNGDVYYVYGNRDAATTNNRLAIRRLTDNGAGGLAIGAEHFVTGQVQAAIPSVAVAANGTVGVFYYTFDGLAPITSLPTFTAHLALSDDGGATFADIPLLTFLSSATDNGNTRQRVFGDYMQMKTVGNCFYGAFTGNGVPFGRSFANHDPIFFKTCVAVPDTIINSGPTAASGGATNSTTAVFNFFSDDPTSTFACKLNNAPFVACTSPETYTKLKVGAHNFKVQATAGGATDPSPASFDWTIDKIAPNTTLTVFPALLTKNPIATFEFISTEAGGFQCSLDGSLFTPCTSPFVSSALADGKHNFQVKAFDAAGNVDKSAARAKAWTVDTIPPDTTITKMPANPTTSTSAKFKFKSTEKKSTFECKLDSAAGFTSCTSAQTFTLPPGAHHIEVRAIDGAGNMDPSPAIFDWTIN